MFTPTGDTVTERQENVQQMKSDTLNELYAKKPETKGKMDQAVGYGIFSKRGAAFLIGGSSNGFGTITDKKTSKETYMDEEGCLSFPEVKAQVERKERVTFKAKDLLGREMVYHADELFARCIQHELDHLNGVIFIERLTPSQRAEVSERLKELEAQFKKLNEQFIRI